MIFARMRLLFVAIFLLVCFVVVFVLLGAGSYSESEGGAFSERMVRVSPTEKVASVSGIGFLKDVPVRDLPPKSTLSFDGRTLRAEGEVIGVWEPQHLFAGRVYGFSGMNRSQDPFLLTDGNLLRVSKGSTLKFRYGGEVDPVKDFFDVLAFEVGKGDLMRGSKTNEFDFSSYGKQPRPVVLRSRQPESVGDKLVGIPLDLAPGVYVISVAASVAQGNARYNFRVLVE